MTATPRGTCLVCGAETANRCSRCLEAAHIDLFFCSPECQKSVWPGHKLFCGKNAFPLAFPLLTCDEADAALRNIDKPIVPDPDSDSHPTRSLARMAALVYAIPRNELTDYIEASTEGAAHSLVRLNPVATEVILRLSFGAIQDSFPDSPRVRILVTLSKISLSMYAPGFLPHLLACASVAQAVLFHQVVCLSALVQTALDQPESDLVARWDAIIACWDAIMTYTAAKFSPDDAEAIKNVLNIFKERPTQGPVSEESTADSQ